MASAFAVIELRERPDFAAAVADRVWRAWWKPKGHPLTTLEASVAENLGPGPIPSALVAHDGDAFLGTASLIACDLEARPQYTPWVAAVWVEAAHRRQGIGAALVRAGADRVHGLGYGRAYLCAMPENHAFYARLGWSPVEEGVSPDGLAVFRSR